MDLFQGPGPPWCIGSVPGAHQLNTTSEPFLFDAVGEPDELLQTGCKLQQFDDPLIHPVEQLDYIFEDVSLPYAPGSIVKNLFQDDTHAKLALIHESNLVLGNRLSCLQFSDGKLQLIFPVGENLHCLGGMLCYKDDDSGRWCPVRKEEDEPDLDWMNGVRLSISNSLRQPIRQLTSSNVSGSPPNESLVLARTAYEIHLTNVRREDDRVCFASNSVASFTKGVSHVTWNPHTRGELATVLETGQVLIYDLHSTKKSTQNLHQVLEFTAERPMMPPAKTLIDEKISEAIAAQMKRLRNSWWRCEFGWHPRTLLVANVDEISMIDLRAKNNNKPLQLASSHSSRHFCSSHADDNRFVALARSDSNSYHFSTSTQQHLQLFDVRRPRTPLLQWEHMMENDPPGYLSMLPVSTLCGGKENASSSSGSVIMAASFRSGDIRCFRYGLQASSALIIPGASTRFREIEESYCSWHSPTKLSSSHLREDCWMEFYRNSANILTKQTRDNDKVHLDCTESLSGVGVFPNQTNGFGLIQLSGSGGVFVQRVSASKVPKWNPAKRVDPPRELIRKPATKAPSKLEMVVLTNYFLHGVVCANDYVKATEHKEKRIKLDNDQELRQALAKIIEETLEDVDVFVSTYELAFQALFKSLPESLQKVAAGMPSDVTRWYSFMSRAFYMLPPVSLKKMEELPVPIPLVCALETHYKLQETMGGSYNYFDAACGAVEEAVSGLRKEQEEDHSSDSEDEAMEKHKYHFHTYSGTPVDSRFQNFIGVRGSDDDSGHNFGAPSLKLKFKSTDYLSSDEVDALAFLQEDFIEWQQSFSPYAHFCKERKFVDK